MSWRAGLRSGSSNFDEASRQAAINLEESLRREQARKRAVKAALQRPPSTGTTPVSSRPNTPTLPEANGIMVNFEDENGEDAAKALQEACANVNKDLWDPKDLHFFFNQIEIKMAAVGVKKQYTKFQVLSTVLPKKVIEQVKSLLRKKETEFPANNSYKLLKERILSIFGPRPEEAVERALSRVLVDRPSDLARELVEDLCRHELVNCQCCPAIVLTLWKRQLSSSVRAGIAHLELTAATFDQVVKLVDDIHSSNKAVPVVAAIDKAESGLDETQPAIPYPAAEVAGVSRGRGGRGRGGRGGRNNRGGRGGGAQNKNQPQDGSQPKHKGPKHPDLPSGEWKGCGVHYKYGPNAYFCAEPTTCPWKNVIKPKNN